jgi:exosortase/archaeosortase family protein
MPAGRQRYERVLPSISGTNESALSSVQNSAPERVSAGVFSMPVGASLAICVRLLLSLIMIAADYLAAPALYNGSTLWATAGLLLLIFRRGQAVGANSEEPGIARLSIARLAIFLALHAIIITIGRSSGAILTSAAASDALAAAPLAAAKLLILLPVIALFSRSDWSAILRKYRAEFLAALIVLLTFFPYRLFHTIWPAYSQLIATLAYYGAKPFVAGLAFINQPIPTIAGPQINLQIVFWCSGFSALALFDTLVALIAILDWNELNHARLLTAYIAGGAAILAANIVRISLLVIIGNDIGPEYAMGRFHVNAGWAFFAVIYLIILTVSYRWMLKKPS